MDRIGRSLCESHDLFQHRGNVESIMEPLVSVILDAIQLKEDLKVHE